LDGISKKSKGFAFVRFDKPEHAAAAMRGLDGKDFEGRFLHIIPGRKGVDDVDEEEEASKTSNLTYKQRQELLKQKNAATSQTGWNTSVLRSDAVLSSLSQRLSLPKSSILDIADGSGGDAAVRLALAETEILRENKLFFDKEGIDMDVIVSSKTSSSQKKVKRSDCRLLVKNLPHEATAEELKQLFASVGGGDARRVVLAPSKTVAVVDYDFAVDARRAFKKLAYRRFHDVPLYLEWAPMSSSSPAPPPTSENESAPAPAQEIEDEDDDTTTMANCTVYVKNLSFQTTEDQLSQHFSKNAPQSIRSVTVPKKTLPNGTAQSVGFGFVEFISPNKARDALKNLQKSTLRGHELILSLSTTTPSSQKQSTSKTKKSAKLKKLMVRNVPFQATKSEIHRLFASFGDVKKVRLPKTFNGRHRGFAFVEFVTGDDAKVAMRSLGRSHLYGRHLVLEWAEEEENGDGL